MLICNYCGQVISEDELEIKRTATTSFHNGVGIETYYEDIPESCSCGGDFIEAKQCEICEEWNNPDDIYNEVCEKCLQENATFENALKYGGDEYGKVNVEINGFIATLLGQEKINQILEDYVRLNKLPQDEKVAKEFCLNDKYDFSYFVKEQNK